VDTSGTAHALNRQDDALLRRRRHMFHLTRFPRTRPLSENMSELADPELIISENRQAQRAPENND
jgi:hypothetical protein